MAVFLQAAAGEQPHEPPDRCRGWHLAQTATPRLPPEFDVATHSGQVIITHSNRPFGCRHPRSLSFGAESWRFARAAKFMVKLLRLVNSDLQGNCTWRRT